MDKHSRKTAISDAERLAALEEGLAKVRDKGKQPDLGADKFHQANQAWRMVLEMVTGLVIGFGIGYGLDRLFGTLPFLLVLFTLLGLAAGIKTMLRTAREIATSPDKGSGAERKE